MQQASALNNQKASQQAQKAQDQRAQQQFKMMQPKNGIGG